MSVWLVIAALCAVLVAILIVLPVRLRLSLQGRGDPSGFWALAGGAQLGPAAASGVAARGVEGRVQAHVFGRQVWATTASELREKRRARAEAEEPEEALSLAERSERALTRIRERYRKLERWFDPEDVATFLLRERRRIEVELVVVDLDYSFVDIALTGKLLGAIYAFSAFLPAQVVVRQNPSWESEDRAAIVGSGTIRIRPGLLLVDAAWFLVRNVRIRRRTRAPKGAPEAT